MFGITTDGDLILIKKYLPYLKEYLVVRKGKECFISENNIIEKDEYVEKKAKEEFYQRYYIRALRSKHSFIANNYILNGNKLYKKWGVNPEMELDIKDEIEQEEVNVLDN